MRRSSPTESSPAIANKLVYVPTASAGDTAPLRTLLTRLDYPFERGQSVGVKIHWGERGNHSFLPPHYTQEIVTYLRDRGYHPFVFDTTVLYSGGRRTAQEALETARRHGFSDETLGCPVVIADGDNGRSVIDIDADDRHFKKAQVTALVDEPCGFVIFSHFKGHLAAGFGGAIKNISMGFASRAQKQRMHAEVTPRLRRERCTQCGVCSAVCPTGAAQIAEGAYPTFNLDTCIGCAQCIALCPETALAILWNSDGRSFQEKLVETSAAVWRKIHRRAVIINALVTITSDCDCMPGQHPIIAPDSGFIGGYHPVTVDRASVRIIGEETLTQTHPSVPWKRQFSFAREIGFDAPDDTAK